MKAEKPLSLRTQLRLADNICHAVNTLVDYQSRLHRDVRQDAVNMQVEANRLYFKVKQLVGGTRKPKPARRSKTRKGGMEAVSELLK